MKGGVNFMAEILDGKMDKFALLREKLREREIHINNNIMKRTVNSNRAELSYEQKQIWFLEQLNKNMGFNYHIPNVIRITGELHKDAFEQALKMIVGKHKILRTIFLEEEGRPYQLVTDKTITSVEYCKMDKQEFYENEYMKHQGLDFFHQEFRLDQLPLFRIRLVEINILKHILFLDIHHIIADGWTLNLFTKEFFDCYTDIVLGTNQYDASEPEIQYVDYAELQRENKQLYEKSLKFWKIKLDNCTVEIKLPWRKDWKYNLKGEGAYQKFEISQELTHKLRKLGRSTGATMYTVLLSLYTIQLFRLGDQNDIVIGTTVSKRSNYQIQEMLGLFANTIPIRFIQEEDISFIEYLSKCSKTIYEAFKNQDVPFNLIVESLKVERDLDRNPLFQVLFTFQNSEMTNLFNKLLCVEVLEVDTGMSQFDLSITFREENHKIIGFYEYNTEVFDQDDIMKYINNFQFLIQQILLDSSQSIFSMDILSEVEEKILSKWEHGERFAYSETSIIEMFQNQVRENSGRLAVSCNGITMTYRELNDRVNQVVVSMQKILRPTEEKIGIMLDYSVDLIVAILAVLKLGLTYIPLDPNIPFVRYRFIRKDCQIQYIVSNSQFISTYQKLEPNIEYIDIHNMGDKVGKENIEAELKKEIDTACIIYTSGTTGVPKGVMITRDALVNLVHSFIISYQATEKDGMMPLTSLASSSFLGELFPMLCVGGRLVLTSHETMLDTNKLIEVMKENDVTIISSVPSLLSKLNFVQYSVDSLRLILSGGERFVKKDYRKVSKDVKIVNGYGITEAAICSTYIIVNPNQLSEFDSCCVGKPIINTNVYVLDQYHNRLPEKCIGRIFISGKGISKGYINNQKMTEKYFLENPYDLDSRLYDTGDYGYWENGNLICKGRKDSQVKVRGYRIELEEIEKTILECDGVDNCVCVIQQNRVSENCITCFIVLKEKYSVEYVRDYVKTSIPFYMQPSEYIPLNEIPVNRNGKKDLSYLVSLKFSQQLVETKDMTENQKKIYDIWKELIGIDQFDIDENFFDIGGHSLIMMQVQAKIESVYGMRIEIADLYRYTTVRTLTEFLEGEHNSGDELKEIKQNAILRANKAKQAIRRRRGGK